LGVLAPLRSPVLSAQDNSVIRVPVRLVEVPTLVISAKGHVISNLNPADFHLLDDDRPQTISVETEPRPVSVVVAIQSASDVREYLPFISKSSSLMENSLKAVDGELAIVSYNDGVELRKGFGDAGVQPVTGQLSASGSKSRLIDAGLASIELLKERPQSRARIIIFVGQPIDKGSEATLETLEKKAELESVSVFALALPLFGKSFVSDTVSIKPISPGGFTTGVELTRLIPALRHQAQAKGGLDPFSILADASGGTRLQFRTQRQLEDLWPIVGQELRSLYRLTYVPDTAKTGHHNLQVQVNIPGAHVYSRSGYDRE
jgi:VWFA-related protein